MVQIDIRREQTVSRNWDLRNESRDQVRGGARERDGIPVRADRWPAGLLVSCGGWTPAAANERRGPRNSIVQKDVRTEIQVYLSRDQIVRIAAERYESAVSTQRRSLTGPGDKGHCAGKTVEEIERLVSGSASGNQIGREAVEG